MGSFTIDSFQPGEEPAFSALVKRVFDEFVGPGYTEEGNRFFYEFIAQDKILERFRDGNLLLTAKRNGAIIGIIEIRDCNHICLLFVDKAWQGRGVAKRLLNEALRLCKSASGAVTHFEVNASPFSETIYAKLGFIKEREMQEINGMQFVPMRMAVR
jgi:GNAT superfamily N-acetyltransferase